MRVDVNTDGGQVDVAIVGGGAAGLSAALTLGRALRRVVVIDSGEPRNAPAVHMHGYLGHDGLSPRALLMKGRAEIAKYGVTVVEDVVTGIEGGDGPGGTTFTLGLRAGAPITARRVLLAIGTRDDLPDIPGLADGWGTAVHICPYCHGYEVRNQPLAVIATGEHSPTYALMIQNWSDDLIYFEHERGPLSEEERLRFNAMGIRRVSGRIRRVVTEGGRLTAIEMESGERFNRSAVFLSSLLAPDTALLERLGIEVRQTPQGTVVETDPQGRTSVPGIWAAGNVTNSSSTVVGAAAAGNLTAGGINMDLILEDVQRRVEETTSVG